MELLGEWLLGAPGFVEDMAVADRELAEGKTVSLDDIIAEIDADDVRRLVT